MIDFAAATDAELQALRDAIDALTREEPQRIFTDRPWSDVVHAVNNEAAHRANRRLLAERARVRA